jgi:hypothetical protein
MANGNPQIVHTDNHEAFDMNGVVHACCESGHSADGDGQSCDRDILTSK